ncbi:hypothetical protein SLEP1_g11520 [Rubroshorea leprosula]|uniref:Uncharacterized protein n=1 Tax=Rubroshorea leprosula TaxID=152421 RepID=A0AAV5IBL5_9ROSI|nr:hypothetical protein SLEP1_g11520 [Rubroshorea leprosula]
MLLFASDIYLRDLSFSWQLDRRYLGCLKAHLNMVDDMVSNVHVLTHGVN